MKHRQNRRIILMGIIFFFFILFIFPSGVLRASDASRTIALKSRGGEVVGAYKNSFALLVGVSDYTAGWPDLEQIPEELRQVEKLLYNQKFKVIKIINPNARELKAGFEDFIYSYGYEPSNRLLFYYSGHGYTMNNGNKGFLVPADAPDPRKSPRDFKRKALDMNQIFAWCRGIDARHDLFLFDSCFSGVIFKQKDLPETPPHITKMTAKPVRQFITAGSAGEPVPAKSVFTPAFVDAIKYGLGDLNKDGYISGTELGLYLQTTVQQYNNRQSPQYGKIKDYNLSRGDFVFKMVGGVTPAPSNSNFHEQVNNKNSDVESLFWESIKDSEDSKMFEAYLEQFPLGIFVKLARLKIKEYQVKLEENGKVNVREEIVLPAKFEDGNQQMLRMEDEANNESNENLLISQGGSQRVKLAIFPWKLEDLATRYIDSALRDVKDVISQNIKEFNPVFSYYTLGRPFNEKRIQEVDRNELWIKKSFFSSLEPNVSKICKLGNSMQVDAVLICHLKVNENLATLKGFLVNVHTNKVFKTVRFGMEDHDVVKNVIREIFSKYQTK